MAPSRVFLVGMMASGKSSVGRALAARLGWRFVDTDRWIEKKEGVSVSALFEKEGETAFRRLEAQALDWACRRRNCVVATGGGLVVQAALRRKMKTAGPSVYLRISAPAALRRLGSRERKRRPLLAHSKPLAVLEDLLKARRRWYRQATVTVSALGQVEAVAARIQKRLGL